MSTTVGLINGLPVDFLVDTAASMTAMSSAGARRLGIAYRLDGQHRVVKAASGLAKAYAVKLDTVKVGDILRRTVDAVVLDHVGSGMVLLRDAVARTGQDHQRGTSDALGAQVLTQSHAT